MSKTNFLLLLYLLLMASFPLMAQRNFKVTGKVVSSFDGKELPGATVLIKGTQIGVAADNNGNFSININNYFLQLSEYLQAKDNLSFSIAVKPNLPD